MRIRFGAICIIFLLNACAPTPPRIELKPDLPSRWRNSPSTENARMEISATWWESLGDPVLDESVALALKQNLSLAQASERLIAARAMERATLANQRPSIDFLAGPDNLARPSLDNSGNANANSSTSSRTNGAYIAGFDLNWELPLFHRGSAQRGIARGKILSAIADIYQNKISIEAEVVRIYGDLRAAQERIRAYNHLAENQESLDAILNRAEHVGLIGKSEKESAHDALINARKAEQQAYIAKESALQRLMVLCGLSTPLAGWSIQNDGDWSFVHAGTAFPAIPANLIRRRPEVKLAEASVLQASGEAGVARADLYPKLMIEGALMIVGNLAGASRATQTVAMLAPSVHIPLLDWGLARAVVDARDAKLRESIFAYREAVLLAIEETENAFSQFSAANKALSLEDDEVTRQHALAVNARTAYKAGLLSKPELLRIENQALDRKLRRIDTQATWFAAFAVWNKVQAIIDDAEIKQISNS